MNSEGFSADSGGELDIPKPEVSNQTPSEYPEFNPEAAQKLRDAVNKAKSGIVETQPRMSDVSESQPDGLAIEAPTDDAQQDDTESQPTDSATEASTNIQHDNSIEQTSFDQDDQDTQNNQEVTPEDSSVNDTPETQEVPDTPEAQDNQENREKSRAEKRLDSLKEQIEKINQEIDKTNLEKEDLAEQIFKYETDLGRNFKEHEELSDKLVEIRKEVKKTRRNLFASFATGFELLKNQLFGDNEKIEEIGNAILSDNKKNKEAKASQKETEDKLEANENEKNQLETDYINARDSQKDCTDKLSRLEHQKTEINKRLALLEEEIAEEKEIEARRTARQEIRSEMGSDNPRLLRRELDDRQRGLDEGLARELGELDSKYRNPSRVDRLMRSEEELQRDKERSDEAEEILRQEHAAETAAIKQQRERVEQYFPTLPERIKDIRENDRVNKALGSLKRKILMRVYGIV